MQITDTLPHLALLALLVLNNGCGDATKPEDDPLGKLRILAKAGDPRAQFQLGNALRAGKEVPQDLKAAARWYHLAAKSGFADAQHNLGVALDHGKGVPEDDKKAVQWYLKAALQGLPGAQFSLGRMHLFGHGTKRDPAVAARWFRQAATEGHREAIHHLGLLHRDGLGVPRDLLQAGKYFLMAANQGMVEGQVEYHQLAPRLTPPQRELAEKLSKEEAAGQQPRPSLGGAIEFRNNLVYVAGHKESYSGKASLLHPNGVTSREINVLDGQLHGWESTWHPNGAKATRILHEKGRRHGAFMEWYPNKAVRIQGTNHLNQLLNATAYNPVGKATSRVIEGNGSLVIHHLEGWKTAERTFIEGKLQATRRWDANGTEFKSSSKD